MSEERGVYVVNELTRIAEADQAETDGVRDATAVNAYYRTLIAGGMKAKAALALTMQWQAMRMDTVLMMGAME